MSTSASSVSIITATCYDHRLAFINLYQSIKNQHYKNIKEWVIYNSSGEDDHADFAKFFDKFERNLYLNIEHKIAIKVLNNGADRVTDRKDCDVLNDLVAAATCDVVVVMTDRDQYSPIRVSSAVNTLKNNQIAFNREQFIYSLDKEHDSVFIVNSLNGVNNFASSLAFHRNMVTDANKFDEFDSIYDVVFGILEDRTEDDVGQISNEYSYMVYKTFICDDNLWQYIPHAEYSYALKRRIAHTEKMMNSLLSNKSAIVTAPSMDECPVCFSDTNCRLKSCKHTICSTCVDMLATPCCPMCRDEFKSINISAWNMEYWGSDNDDDDEDMYSIDSQEEEEEEEEEDEDELIEMEESDAEEEEEEAEEIEIIPIMNADRIRFNNELLTRVFDPIRVDNLCLLYGLTRVEYCNILE